MIKTYKYNDTTQLSEHFNVSEFRCKCGKNHDIKINDETVQLLEKLRDKFNSSACVIYSGYRCSAHDKKVGGFGNGPHTKGYAVDCYFDLPSGAKVNSKDIALTLEDMGHKGGIGYRCGGSNPESGQTHIDTLPRKWYGDESKGMNFTLSSYYDYFGIKKEIKYEVGQYKLLVAKAIRNDHTLEKNIVKVGQCMKSVKPNLTSTKSNEDAYYKVGTIVNITEIYTDNENRVWGKLQNCWIVLCNKNGDPQAKRI